MIIELISTLVAFWAVFWFILLLWNARKTRKLRQSYNPNDDLSKKGETGRDFGGGGFESIENPEHNPPRPDQPTGGGLLQTTDASNPRKDSSSTGRVGLFRKLQKR